MKSAPSTSGEIKWVDRYLLRYGPGTLLGAGFMAYWYSVRREFGITASFHFERGELLALFVGTGFLFCYVASAPILVSHVTRALYAPRQKAWLDVIASIVSVVITVLTSIRYSLDGINLLMAIVAGIAWAIWFLALAVGLYGYIARQQIFEFYRDLCSRRASDENGFVESYRTMREHGNAFLILLYEVLFAACITGLVQLFKIQGMNELLALALILAGVWIAPAAIVWSIASRLEADFVTQT